MEENQSILSKVIQAIKSPRGGLYLTLGGVLITVVSCVSTFILLSLSPSPEKGTTGSPLVAFLGLFSLLMICVGVVIAIIGGVVSLLQNRKAKTPNIETTSSMVYKTVPSENSPDYTTVPPKNNPRYTKSTKVMLVILVFGCLCFVLIAILNPSTPTPKVSNTSVAEAESTPIVTVTEIPTNIPATNTLEPTKTATPTLIPETATAIAQNTIQAQATLDQIASQTAISVNATATRAQKVINITATAQSVIESKTQQAIDAQSTKIAQAATATYLAEFTNIDYRELRDYADQHVGEKVCVRGRIFNIVSSDALQMYFAGTYDAIYIAFKDSFSGIYENDTITVCGTVYGFYSFQNALGATISQPAIFDVFLRQ